MTPSGPDLPSPVGRRAALVLVGFAAGAGLAVWLLRPAAPGDESAEAGFARDMATHHIDASDERVLALARISEAVVRQ